LKKKNKMLVVGRVPGSGTRVEVPGLGISGGGDAGGGKGACLKTTNIELRH